MSGPQGTPPRFGVPVHAETGEPLTDAQMSRIQTLRQAHRTLLDTMHDCEGSSTGNDQFQTRRMAIAATQIELGMMMAVKAALETD